MLTLLDCHIPELDWLKETSERDGLSPFPLPSDDARKDRRNIADAGPWELAVQQIIAFQDLGDNWDGLGARAPSRELLESAIGLAYCFLEKGVDPPQCVVPGVDGTIMFEWQEPDGTYKEVEIVRPLYAEVMMMEPGKPARHWTLPTE